MISDTGFKLNNDPRDSIFDVLLKFENDEDIVDESTKKERRKFQMRKRLE